MAQKLDLGRSTLRIRDSKLQLRLAASANFTQPLKHGAPQIPIDLSHLPNVESVWITEAPELELRFFIGGNWGQNEAAAFISKLRGKLWDMEIWSDLGFSVEIKTGAGEYCIGTSGTHCLELGLRRGWPIHNHKTGRTLPSMMTNPPDACPPPGVSIATLASIDVWLEYRFQGKDIPQSQDPSELEVGLGQGSSVFHGPQRPETMTEVAILQAVHDEDFHEAIGSQFSCISGDGSDPSLEELLRLFDLGIQRLVISNSIKDPTISVSQQATLKSLADISPAVFDPGYRDAMNQRGITIPIITKAISSMLAGNKDPSTQAKLADLLELARSRHPDELMIQPQFPSWGTAVLSSLWSVAQKNVPKTKPMKRRVSMLSAECLSTGLTGLNETVSRMPTDQQQSDSGNPGLGRSFQTGYHNENEESDICLLNSESEDQLLDNFSETSFTDIGDSTQTSLDTLLSTIGSSQTSYGDHDPALLSDHGELADYPGNYTTDYDPREDMEAYDTDIIMADYL
ncbi:hypothetical protein N7489_010324 [Penicillium chrysogenum]|uniref:Uncharacterized protein n=1 Tax=Penicillium chrysogenum TaxID=5076 RepID=A0ABQ8WU67_PENCH|nr:uncharacterized protein N7489_010324 [Penicillium chrysogenum]KAJ5229616.1 hypothetical protein N7489_010324 [Penicillium chrysogenum]KAJ5259021.1 hypothetical protein N7524_010577 [Penicillium chrysogenum]KAJ5282498.1 hypothetical protein N7505_000478 [Penicillium chrysogenum]